MLAAGIVAKVQAALPAPDQLAAAAAGDRARYEEHLARLERLHAELAVKAPKARSDSHAAAAGETDPRRFGPICLRGGRAFIAVCCDERAPLG